jgi:hypothetical protein
LIEAKVNLRRSLRLRHTDGENRNGSNKYGPSQPPIRQEICRCKQKEAARVKKLLEIGAKSMGLFTGAGLIAEVKTDREGRESC